MSRCSVVVHGKVGREGGGRLGVLAVVVAQVAVNPADGGSQGEVLAEHHGVGHIERHLVWLDAHAVVGKHLTEGEIA